MKPKETTLCYKVIRKKDRNSYVIEEPEFVINYPINKVVKKIPDSIGICCFKHKYHAIHFCEKIFDWKKTQVIIIPVLGIGKPRYPKHVAKLARDNDWYCLKRIYKVFKFRNFYNTKIAKYLRCTYNTPPEGTVCYEAVIPLK